MLDLYLLKKKMLLSIDNLLDNTVCDNLIQILNNNKEITTNHLGSIKVHCMELNNEHKLYSYKVSRFIHSVMTKHINEVVYPDNIEIVLKQPSVELGLHTDRSDRDFVSITYLNSLNSGHTYIEGFGDIKPEKGRTIFFKGNEMLHGNRSPEEDRYTFIAWYTKDINKINISLK